MINPQRPRAITPATKEIVTRGNRRISCDFEPFSFGSEGKLYFSRDGKEVVKIYHQPDPWREGSIKHIIEMRSGIMGKDEAYWARFLCWPTEIVRDPGLGIVMPRARSGLRPFAQLLSPRFRARLKETEGAAVLGGWIGHVGILMKLARIVNQIHSKGICHSDLSSNNLLVNAATGDVMLIDCDGLVSTTGSDLCPPPCLARRISWPRN